MQEAIRIYSPEKGFGKEILKATEIKSHAHARKLAPFIDDTGEKMYWVSWGKEKSNGKPRVAHFKRYPHGSQQTLAKELNDELTEKLKQSGESHLHKNAKQMIKQMLEEMILQHKHLPWAFKDDEISSFAMTGDLLAGAISIEIEHPISTPFGKDYRLDVAILGKKIAQHPVLLAGIELELTNKFDFSKALLCKSAGFPLISIDIAEVEEGEIDLDWARNALMETTQNSCDGFRRNYIYIHRLLSTVYIDIPREIVTTSRHQYVIFCDKQQELSHNLERLQDALNLTNKQVHITSITNKNKQLETQIINAGKLAGEEWEKHNPNGYIQLTIDKPASKSGDLYHFHLVLAKLCNSIYDCLVGYKYETGPSYSNAKEYLWCTSHKVGGKLTVSNLAPKRVSEPVIKILNYINR